MHDKPYSLFYIKLTTLFLARPKLVEVCGSIGGQVLNCAKPAKSKT
jgi:hypothetical protein